MKIVGKRRSFSFVIASIMMLFQILTLISVFVYSSLTQYDFDIKLVVNKNSTIVLKTPLNDRIIINAIADDTVFIKQRPLKDIYINAYNSEESVDLLSLTPENRELITDYQVLDNGQAKVLNVINFFIQLNYHFVWIVITAFLFLLIVVFNLANISKYILWKKKKFLRFIVSKKPSRLQMDDTNLGVFISQKIYKVLIVLAVLWTISLFVGVGRSPIRQDESAKWRALVALEMKYSNNFVTPTLNGEIYHNKPPLFNYLLLPLVESENNLEFKLRLVNVVSIILLCIVVYFIASKEFDKKQTLLVTLTFAFSHALYLIGSLKLSLDPFFSLLVVILFYCNYKFVRHNNILLLFICGYSIAALAFLTKGYQAIFFQFVSLFSVLFVFNRMRLLISWKHLIGVFIFCCVVGTYALLYKVSNPNANWFSALFSDVIYKLDIDGHSRFLNFVSFVGKSVFAYFFLVFFLIIFYKRFYFIIFKNKFIFYSVLISVIGVCPFILGDYYSQYIMMIVPFIIIVLFKALPLVNSINKRDKIVVFVITSLLVVIPVAFVKSDIVIVSVGVFLMILLFCLVLFVPRIKIELLIGYFGILLLLRIVAPFTTYNYDKSEYLNAKTDAKDLISKVNETSLYIYPNNKSLNYATMFYLTYYYKNIITVTDSFDDKSSFYLASREHIPQNAIVVDSVAQMTHYFNPDPYGKYLYNNWLYLIKFNVKH